MGAMLKIVTRTAGLSLPIFIASVSFGEPSLWKVVPADSPFNKIVAEVSQLSNPNAHGNAWFTGTDGCSLITNVHVGFGKDKKIEVQKSTGKKFERVIFVDNPAIGHQVKIKFDYNSTTGEFTRSAIATVAAFEAWEQGPLSLERKDLMRLNVSPCLGPDYAGIPLDRSEENQKNPTGELSIVTSIRTPDGKNKIIFKEGCRTSLQTPAAGLIGINCVSVAGMSGAMWVTKDTNSRMSVVGINKMSMKMDDGTPVAVAISAKFLNKFLDEYSGHESIAIAPVAKDEKRLPQSDETVAAVSPRISSPRTVVK